MNETPRTKKFFERISQVVSSKVKIPSMWQWQEPQDSYCDTNQDFNFVSFPETLQKVLCLKYFKVREKKKQLVVQKVEKLETSGKFGCRHRLC